MRKNSKKRRLFFILSILAISALALIFIIVNFRNQIIFFYSPSELKTQEILTKVRDKPIRVGGLVVENSILKRNSLSLEFTITDLENDLRISYQGLAPDLFREKQGVVAKGKYNYQKDEFEASELLIKHDEKYMPPEVAKSIKTKN